MTSTTPVRHPAAPASGPQQPGPQQPRPQQHGGRCVTRSQVDAAVLQLRERPRQSAAEQVQAVLRVLDLVVVPDPEAPDPEAPDRGTPGPRS